MLVWYRERRHRTTCFALHRRRCEVGWTAVHWAFAVKIATWNVNSIRSRLERLAAWLHQTEPDVLCLQELKATDEAFPYEPIRALGYHAAVFGQKAYNGVAILSRREPENVRRGMTGFDDPAARWRGGVPPRPSTATSARERCLPITRR
jgi:exodeoxyribonuclease-3